MAAIIYERTLILNPCIEISPEQRRWRLIHSLDLFQTCHFHFVQKQKKNSLFSWHPTFDFLICSLQKLLLCFLWCWAGTGQLTRL